MSKGTVVFWSVFIAAAAFRLWHSFVLHPPDLSVCLKHPVEGRGVITVEPERKENAQAIVVQVNELITPSLRDAHAVSCGSGFSLKLKTKLYPRFGLGDTIDFKGNLTLPQNFGDKEDPGRSFDYKGYLAKDDIFYEIKSATVTTTSLETKASFLSSISRYLFLFKMGFVSNLNRTLGDPHAALAAGLVVGEKAALGKDLIDDFRTVGLIHIVVLSGYNITIVAAALRKMLSFLPRVWGIIAGGIGIMLFGVMVGGGATVVRSCFMAGMALAADVSRRDYSVHRALFFAALVMVIQNPLILLHDPSFQLSFLATFGLLLLAGPVESRLGFITERLGMRGIVASTIATQIFVSPFILYLMGQISIIGMVVNILVLPFIPLTMLLVSVTGLAGFLSYALSSVAAWSAHLFLAYELFMVEHFARLPFAAFHMRAFSAWWVGGFYAVFVGAYICLKIRDSRMKHKLTEPI